MEFDFVKFGITLAVWAVVSALLLFLFPLTTQELSPDNYDFATHSYKTKINWTSIIGIFIVGVVLFVWLISRSGADERSIVRNPKMIFESNDMTVQRALTNSEVTHPVRIVHEHALGNFSSIGFLWIVELLNIYDEPIFFTLIGDNNYRDTAIRQRFESPVLNTSNEFYDIRSSLRYMTPKERGNITDKIKGIYKELKGEDKSYAESILKRSYEEAEKETEDLEE